MLKPSISHVTMTSVTFNPTEKREDEHMNWRSLTLPRPPCTSDCTRQTRLGSFQQRASEHCILDHE